MRDRAEVILFNQCFGNEKELIQQFNEVRRLNPRLSKPVLHVTLSLHQGENLPVYKLQEMAQDCAQDLGFAKNQFIAIVHKDTNHPHIHIVANRVGLDGKTVSDSNNFKKIAQLCRKLELRHELKQVLSPRAFLPKELREIPRLDQRKQKLNEQIKQCLAGSKNYEEFEQKMKTLKYEVIKMRGIAFKDAQRVYTKGSEVGYSLGTIERILAQKQALKPRQKAERRQSPNNQENTRRRPGESTAHPTHETQMKIPSGLQELLPEESTAGLNPDLMQEERRQRRRQRHRH